VYAGRVGTGFSESQREALGRVLGAIRREAPIIRIPAAMDAVWVEPGVYCEVSYLEKTVNGELRAASFEGLVTDSP
jgi:bifunctional non-homologous end joining protein LigD